MSSSVLSVAVAALAFSGNPQFSDLENKSWNRVYPSLATLIHDGKAVGMAALIGKDGVFMAHRTSIKGNQAQALMSDNTLATLTLKASDGATQLAVLKADKWPKSAIPLTPVFESPPAGDLMIAALPSGPIRAVFVSGALIGVQSQRMVPLSEIQFEATEEQVRGAVILNKHGRLVGFLSATLDMPGVSPESGGSAPIRKGGVKPSVAGSPGGQNFGADRSEPYGPADMTVAYAAAPEMMRRVVESFGSGQREIAYPSIGVFCVDKNDGTGKSMGAEVKKVTKDSPAWQAGIRPDDVIVQVDDKPILDQVTLAKIILGKKIGSQIKVKIRRGANAWTLPVRVGSQTGPSGNPQGAT